MEAAEARERVEAAIARFLAQDRYLLEHDLREECISARLALHLQAAFGDHVVDVEYNRWGDLVKRLHLPEECAKKRDRDGRALVLPDIIVHKRGNDGPNLLVIEMKKTTNPLGFDCDRRRIHAFREELGYQFGALVECETRPRHQPGLAVVEWLPR
jgi:hypothetical protein